VLQLLTGLRRAPRATAATREKTLSLQHVRFAGGHKGVGNDPIFHRLAISRFHLTHSPPAISLN
jgi:hypothetical protein